MDNFVSGKQLAPFVTNNWQQVIVIAAVTFAAYQGYKKSRSSRAQDSDILHPDSRLDDDAAADDEEYPEDDNVTMIPYVPQPRASPEDAIRASSEFYDLMKSRRSLRFFSSDPVPREVIENIILTAGTSPSGANMQPWTFAVVESAAAKRAVREIVEAEEEVNYRKRMGAAWLADLEKFRTGWEKPYLELAPYVIVVFRQAWGVAPGGARRAHYYAELSAGIACGVLIAAIHRAGLVTLTSTPMNAGPALRRLLNRPDNEKVLLLLPVGYPAQGARVPDVGKKALRQIMVTA